MYEVPKLIRCAARGMLIPAAFAPIPHHECSPSRELCRVVFGVNHEDPLNPEPSWPIPRLTREVVLSTSSTAAGSASVSLNLGTSLSAWTLPKT
jgi:hypothetical protein